MNQNANIKPSSQEKYETLKENKESTNMETKRSKSNNLKKPSSKEKFVAKTHKDNNKASLLPDLVTLPKKGKHKRHLTEQI